MKTKWLLKIFVISCLIFSTSVFAQDPGLAVGVKAGLNLSNVYDSQNEDFQADPKLGFAGGAFLSIPIGTYFGIQPELLFSQRGLRGSGSILTSDYTFKRTTNYIDIPLLFAVKPSEMVTIFVGPQYSYLISERYQFDNEFITIDQQEEFENDNIRRNTVCVNTGFDVNVTNFVFSARIGWDLFYNNGEGDSSTPRYKNMWTQATIGYRF